MCLAIPSQVAEKLPNSMANVDIMGVQRVVSLDLTPEAEVGDWVLVHAGFAIQIIDEETANETIELLKTLPFFDDDPAPLIAAEGE